MGECDGFERVGDTRRLCRIALQKLAPGRHVVKERAHLNDCPRTRGCWSRPFEYASVDLDLSSSVRASDTGNHAKTRHARDRRQSLASKSERMNRSEIVARRHLARGVRCNCKRHLLRRDSSAVIGHAYKFGTAALNLNNDAARSCVESILNEFLHDARWPLNNLASSDLINKFRCKDADRHASVPILPLWDTGVHGLVLAPAVMLGGLLGQRLFPLASERFYRRLALGLLVAVAIGSLIL